MKERATHKDFYFKAILNGTFKLDWHVASLLQILCVYVLAYVFNHSFPEIRKVKKGLIFFT